MEDRKAKFIVVCKILDGFLPDGPLVVGRRRKSRLFCHDLGLGRHRHRPDFDAWSPKREGLIASGHQTRDLIRLTEGVIRFCTGSIVSD